MKRFLTLICILICSSAQAQKTPKNFLITDDGSVIWQKVYDTDCNLESLFTNVVNSGRLSDVITLNGMITAQLHNGNVNFKALGYSRGQVPMYIGTGNFSAFVTIQSKEGRYRVTFQDIIVTINRNIGLGERGEETHIEEYVLNKKKQFTSAFLYDAVNILDDYFNSLSTFESRTFINNEW